MRPSARIRLALRAALRRRYGYSALRVFRRGHTRAIAEHLARSIGARRYDGQTEWRALTAAARRAHRQLLERWPRLDFDDERARLSVRDLEELERRAPLWQWQPKRR